jgi:type V secretory pathway adhesin AidA
MDTKRKALIVSGILVAVGGYYIYKNMFTKPTSADEIAPNNTIQFDTTKVLSNGSTGEEVKSLQKALKGGLKVDGIFGDKTEARLKKITGQISTSIRAYNTFIANKSKK